MYNHMKIITFRLIRQTLKSKVIFGRMELRGPKGTNGGEWGPKGVYHYKGDDNSLSYKTYVLTEYVDFAWTIGYDLKKYKLYFFFFFFVPLSHASSKCLFVSLSLCLSICLCIFVSLSVSLCVSLCVSLSLSPSLSLSLSLSLRLSLLYLKLQNIFFSRFATLSDSGEGCHRSWKVSYI